MLVVYGVVLNVELLVPYDRTASPNPTRDWLWYWSVLLMNVSNVVVTVGMPLYHSWRDKDLSFAMPMTRCLHDLTLFLSEPSFRLVFEQFLGWVEERGLNSLEE